METVLLILPLVWPILKACIERIGKRRTARRLQQFGPRVQVQLYRALRQQGLDHQAALGQVQAARQELGEMDEAEIVATMQTAALAAEDGHCWASLGADHPDTEPDK